MTDAVQVKLSQLLRAMSQVADLGEAKILGHGQRVALLALMLTRDMALDTGEQAELAVAGLLHDVGVSSVSYNLFQRVGARDRELLARYPSPVDGLFGVDEPGLDSLAVPLARHADVGVRMLQQVGYGDGVCAAVAGHHVRLDRVDTTSAEPSVRAQILALADHLDTATSHLDTAAARAHAGDAVLGELAGRVVPAALVAQARERLDAAAWESVYFLDELDSRLDALFAPTFGLTVPFDGFEAHLRVLARFVDAQSPYTVGHTFNVTRLAGRIGERIGLEPDGLNRLHVAGLVHGAGRLGISSAILEKPGGLTQHEFMQLHAYPNLTREALSPLVDLRELIDAASTHREKLDGSGYPEGRRGDEIPLIGRILAVSDTFMALISERPYRPAYSHSRALAIIQAESARLFDGLVSDALESVYREGL